MISIAFYFIFSVHQMYVMQSRKMTLKRYIYELLYKFAVFLHVIRQIRSWKGKITSTERPTTVFEFMLQWLHCSHMHTYCAPLVGRHSFPGHCPHSSNGMIKNQSEPCGGGEKIAWLYSNMWAKTVSSSLWKKRQSRFKKWTAAPLEFWALWWRHSRAFRAMDAWTPGEQEVNNQFMMEESIHR